MFQQRVMIRFLSAASRPDQVACEPSVRNVGKTIGEEGRCYGAAREGERGKDHE